MVKNIAVSYDRIMENSKNYESIADFLFETGMLQKTPRSGYHNLGTGSQSVSEHTARAVFVGFVLSYLSKKVDREKILTMLQFHDLSETRISDLNHVHQRYTERKEAKATQDQMVKLPFGKEIVGLLNEYYERKTLESKLAKDADTLEWYLSLKEQSDLGNVRSREMMPRVFNRLITSEAKELARVISKTRSDHWWAKEEKTKK